jgi:hypothetical protein
MQEINCWMTLINIFLVHCINDITMRAQAGRISIPAHTDEDKK